MSRLILLSREVLLLVSTMSMVVVEVEDTIRIGAGDGVFLAFARASQTLAFQLHCAPATYKLLPAPAMLPPPIQ